MVAPVSVLDIADFNATGCVITAFDNLEDGMVRGFEVMVCRRWDNSTPRGECLSTEYLLSDRLGNVVQCSVLRRGPSDVSPQLSEGHVYHIKNVLVTQNVAKHRVCRKGDCALAFLNRTTFIEVEVDTGGFVRHPFYFVRFEEVTYVHDEYLIDVMGQIKFMGNILELPGSCAFLDCRLINGRGAVLDITLWGKAIEDLFALWRYAPTNDSFIFSGMSVQQAEGSIYLIASMATRIYTASELEGSDHLTASLAALAI